MRTAIDKLGKVAVTVEKDYWSNKKTYDKLTIVEKQGIFGTYISRKAVPAGIDITNREYWIPFSSLKEEIVLKFNELISTVDEKESEIYNAISSIIVGGVALKQSLGNSEVFGISQKKITEEFADVRQKTADDDATLQTQITDNDTHIRNIADEEDVTMVSIDERPAIKLKDKTYEPEKYSGLGRKYLRKNITYDVNIVHFGGFVENVAIKEVGAVITDGNSSNVVYDRIRKAFLYKEEKNLLTPVKYYNVWTSEEVLYSDYYQSSFTTGYTIRTDVVFMLGNVPYRWDENDKELAVWSDFYESHSKNILTQAMINEPNTIYHIQYDYDLNGQTITVPEGCTLEFEGGSLRNGSIVGTYFIINGNNKATLSLYKIYSSKYLKCTKCIFEYLISNNLYFIDCRGEGCFIADNKFYNFKSNVINIEGCTEECYIYGNIIQGDSLTSTFNSRRAIHMLHCINVSIINNTINTYPGCAIGILAGSDTEYKHVLISGNSISNTLNGGITSMGGVLKNAIIENNFLTNINNIESEFSALNATLNIHGYDNCVVRFNNFYNCRGNIDIDNTNFLDIGDIDVHDNIFNGTGILLFYYGKNINFYNNKIYNIRYNEGSSINCIIAIKKPILFSCRNNNIDNTGDTTNRFILQTIAAKDRPSEEVNTQVILIQNTVNTHYRFFSNYNTNTSVTVQKNTILKDGQLANCGYVNSDAFAGRTTFLDEGLIYSCSVSPSDIDALIPIPIINGLYRLTRLVINIDSTSNSIEFAAQIVRKTASNLVYIDCGSTTIGGKTYKELLVGSGVAWVKGDERYYLKITSFTASSNTKATVGIFATLITDSAVY